ncbi:hypothetical protein HK098_002771 [Nowakowskiella sp. JEL0407]|nr:hypothetical protein HK098_002771 [Nowakowskiella sp. JEL0407]
MGVSITGVLIPIAMMKFFGQKLQKDGTKFQSLKLFGAGVILATALVHMLIPAFESLSDKCLPHIFSVDYGAWAAIFVLTGIFFTHLMQIILRQRLMNRHLKKPDIEKTNTSLERNERKSSVFVLEMGIMLHSVIIGIILGFARDDFIPLLIALGFHQFFEGLALSTIISEMNFTNIRTVVLTFTAYCFSTPLGVSIGIVSYELVASSYSEQGEIITTGILEAFGAGILLYDVLVNIIAPHFSIPFNSDVVGSKLDMNTTAFVGESDHIKVDDETECIKKPTETVYFMNANASGKVGQMFALYLGAVVMSVIGKWA